MEKTLDVRENKTVYPYRMVIGKCGEKNVDELIITTPIDSPLLKWYLLLEKEKLIPFSGKRMKIDERITSKAGTLYANVVGTDAKTGKEIHEGSTCFISDKFLLIVEEI